MAVMHVQKCVGYSGGKQMNITERDIEPVTLEPCLKSGFDFVHSVMDTSVTSSGILQQLLPTTSTVPSEPFMIKKKAPSVTVQLTLGSSSPDASGNRGGGEMSPSSVPPVNSVSGKTPTCKVCGDESSGYHYGVDSCEGCKGFFRRSITQGMTHKCSNEEKCEVTPFTRNSCQYCRLKKCFAVGMSREASRLGRRPKRLKDCSSEQKRETAVPIAPYPSTSELHNLRMVEFQKLPQNNGTFKSELMQEFLSAAQVSFKEHQRNTNANDNQKAKKSSTSSNSNRDDEYSYTSSGMSSPKSGSEIKSPSEIDKNKNNFSMDSKVRIINENLENCLLDEDITTADDYSSPSQTKTNKIKSCMDIKEEPGLDNDEFSMNDDCLLQNMPNVIKSCSDIKAEPGLDNDVFSMNDDCLLQNMPNVIKSCADIKEEPGQDNDMFSMNDDCLSQNMPNAGSPFFMSELSPDTMIMMPDMMIMMEDSNMMSNMMSGMGMSDMINSTLPPLAGDNSIEIDVEHILSEVKQAPSSLRSELIDQVIQTVGEAHLATVRPTRCSVNVANERFQQKCISGTLPDLKFIDPSNMWHKFVQNMLFEITQAIKFCKKLPGFSEIIQDDQIVLIKKGSFEILLCRMCLLVDHVNQEMFDPSMEIKSPRALIKSMPMGYFIDEFFNVAAEMNPLNLTDKEVGIFSAALIMCPGREGLVNVLAIEKLNMLYLQSLYYEMRNNHSNYERKFTSLISLIPMFNNVNMRHSMALNNLKMQKAPEIRDFPDLHKEIYDINDD